MRTIDTILNPTLRPPIRTAINAGNIRAIGEDPMAPTTSKTDIVLAVAHLLTATMIAMMPVVSAKCHRSSMAESREEAACELLLEE